MMPFIEINQASLYYETYGDDRPDQAPIVLIHGSTSTGNHDWKLVIPWLARHYRVIVPDCRGHGQSSNPLGSYSFRELASDIAALVSALGYPRAHIFGHSNGGNVALVALVEHPQVVQSAVLQAANAYVSQDLIEKEPAIFDPARVERENPAWMQAMIAMHGATHGADYWRTLLRLTLQEIISQPSYLPADLAGVRLPVLVIQGAEDRVNATSRHAQFIAQHIPNAELWTPAGVGHNVHDERPFEWLERIQTFLEQRGDPQNEVLYRMKQARFADSRQTIFELRVAGSQPGEAALKGKVLVAGQLQAARHALAETTSGKLPADSDVRILLNQETTWGLVNRPVTDLCREPRSLGERLTQALLGESLRILEENGEWVRVRLERDGYLGWMQAAALLPCSSNQVQRYQGACNRLVLADQAPAWLTPPVQEVEPAPPGAASGAPLEITTRAGILPFGTAIPVVEARAEFSAVRLPDDRIWWLASSALLPLSELPRPDETGLRFALPLFQRFVGVPYLWGGRTPFGFDCSGLAQTFFGLLGIQIPRDADQQHAAATPVQGEPLPGDLLFFGSSDENAHRPITHVAISLGGDEMIHANGSAWGVSYNSLDPASPIYRDWLRQNLVGVGRII